MRRKVKRRILNRGDDASLIWLVLCDPAIKVNLPLSILFLLKGSAGLHIG